LKHRVIVRTGRLQILDSCGAKVEKIEIDQNILTFQAAEFELATLRAVQFKVGGFISYAERCDKTGCAKEKNRRAQ